MFKKLISHLATKLFPIKLYITAKYFYRTGRVLSLKKPILFNEKLQWLKFYWYDEKVITCVDKYKARDFVKEKVGAQYLSEQYSLYRKGDVFKKSEHPEKYVLKANHASGLNLIVKDNSKVNDSDVNNLISKWLDTNYSDKNGEWAYNHVDPVVVCEEFLEQGPDQELIDYRFMCFNGKAHYIMIDFSINDKSKARRNIYDLHWNLLDITFHWPNNRDFEIPKPTNLAEMIYVSEKLAAGFPHVRVDLYNIDGRIIFGEMTFWHQSGMAKIEPKSFEIKLGHLLPLPSK